MTLRDQLKHMATVREAFRNRFIFFRHVTPFQNVDSIRSLGLVPSIHPGCPREAKETLGEDADKIVCLHPLGADQAPTGTKDPPFMTLAIPSTDLPERVGLDWSYSWQMVQGRMELYPNAPLDVFCSRIAQEWGSIASYDVIKPEDLIVCCQKNSLVDPSDWPKLLTVTNSEIKQHGD